MGYIVAPKNVLKEKVGDGGFSEEALVRAQEAIDENDVDFKPIGRAYLDKILNAFVRYEEDKNDKVFYFSVLDQLMQLKAQGALFNYPSISVITYTIVDFLDSLKKVDSTVVEIVKGYERAANIIFLQDIRAEEDTICAALNHELKTVCKKYTDKQNNS